nr:TlpA family protein disulfide reductase [Propionibacterium sp.]
MPDPERDAAASGRFVTWVVVTVVVALVMGGAWLITRRPAAGASTPVQVSGAATVPLVGKPAPDFTATTLDGRQITVSQLKGRPVWLTFGATWCAPCRVEAPDLQAAFAAHRASGLEVVSVYTAQEATAVREYAELLGLTYAHVPDPQSRAAASYGVNGIPVHFFIGADGVLRERIEGALSRPQMDAALAGIGA